MVTNKHRLAVIGIVSLILFLSPLDEIIAGAILGAWAKRKG